MALIVGNTPGMDMNISEDKIRGYKNFANKLWNIARFVVENTADSSALSFLRRSSIGVVVDYLESRDTKLDSLFQGNDKVLMDELDVLLIDVTKDMEAYRFYMAAEKLYHYAWHTFADKILEESKEILKSGTPEAQKSRKQLLLHTLDKLLRALHPFIPFVTEEIWQLWKQPSAKDGMLMVQAWPIGQDH